MGENSGIAWTDHTFNPWWGCQKVSPACQFCYAEREAKRFGQKGLWESTSRRFFDSVKHWAQPISWDLKARQAGKIARVFSGSMCDVFEDISSVDPDTDAKMNDARESLWKLIESTKNLEWLLLTKRPVNIISMVPTGWLIKPPTNVRIGVTAENQECADMRIPELFKYWKGKNFVSVEPMLGEMDITKHLIPRWVKTPSRVVDSGAPVYLCTHCGRDTDKPENGCPNLVCATVRSVDWVIAGGESGVAEVRPTRPGWVRDLRDQCIATDVPFFFKQWGEWAPVNFDNDVSHSVVANGERMGKVGRTKSGRLLDGVEWLQFPRT